MDEYEVVEIQTSDGSIVTVSVPVDATEEKLQEAREWAETMARTAAPEG